MTELVKYFEGNGVRMVVKKGEPLFCAADVGNILGLTDISRTVKKFEKGVEYIDTKTRGGVQKVVYVDEPNLYRLIFTSRKEEAKLFQDWVFDEVLPAIRKTGKYIIPKDIKEISTNNRKALTNAWKENGVKAPYEYAHLTKESYKQLGFDKDIKKDFMSRDQFLVLNALEAMEMLNLHVNPQDGYKGCKESLIGTAQTVKRLPGVEKAIAIEG